MQQDQPDRDLLAGNQRYKKLQDLNEGTFGVVMLALDTRAKEQVLSRASSSACLCDIPVFQLLAVSSACCCRSCALQRLCRRGSLDISKSFWPERNAEHGRSLTLIGGHCTNHMGMHDGARKRLSALGGGERWRCVSALLWRARARVRRWR